MGDQEVHSTENYPSEQSEIRMLFDALLEEYKQLHDDSQSGLQRATSRANVSVTISFAILAYTIGNDINTDDLLVAAIASVFLYFLALFDFERAIFYKSLIPFDQQVQDVEFGIMFKGCQDERLSEFIARV
ncbi:MAG: hypothetical protein ACR2RF_30315 [Geminicoccaceae bacterium]